MSDWWRFNRRPDPPSSSVELWLTCWVLKILLVAGCLWAIWNRNWPVAAGFVLATGGVQWFQSKAG